MYSAVFHSEITIESVSSRCKYYRQIDYMCSDTWSSDVDFINSLIKELIINAASFTYSIFNLFTMAFLEQEAPLQNAL